MMVFYRCESCQPKSCLFCAKTNNTIPPELCMLGFKKDPNWKEIGVAEYFRAIAESLED